MGFADWVRDALRSSEPAVTAEPEADVVPFVSRTLTNHAGGYYVCSHGGCSKKVKEMITDHDCCGRCSQGRDCLQTAMATYDGPGTFYHQYWEKVLDPGACGTCGEIRAAHH